MRQEILSAYNIDTAAQLKAVILVQETTMQNKLEALESHISNLSTQESFIHHLWFVEHHLKIVERLANELCDLYPAANRDMVLAMTWLHDLGKILTSKKLPRAMEVEITLLEGRKILDDLGFPGDFTDAVIANLELFEQSAICDLSRANIETQIASTADGCAHFIGPFYSLYWYENSDKSISELIHSGISKVKKDWERKITLPEARKAFKPRIDVIMEHDPLHRDKKFFS